MVNLCLMALFALLFFIFFAFLKPSKQHTIFALISLLLLVISMGFSIANEAYHYGMTPTTKTTKKEIYSASPKQNILLYQPLNQKKDETLYMYRTSAHAKKMTTTQADLMVHNQVEHRGDKAMLVQKTTYYTYKNKWIRFFFYFPQKEQEVIKVNNTFVLPSSWHVMTVKAK